VAIRTLRGGDELDGSVLGEGELLGCWLVGGISQPQAAVATFPTCIHAALLGDQKCAELTRLNLTKNETILFFYYA